jgi:hypothetical protein
MPAWRASIAPQPGTRVALGWAAEASIRVAED